ncbi:MAG: histidine kinase, partial [Bacillota bacterium]
NSNPVIEQGVMDLSTWEWEENGFVNLNGDWEFYWKRLLKPQNFSDPSVPQPDILASVPGQISNYQLTDKDVDSNGYFTYRAKIKLPATASQLFAIKLPRLSGTALKVWVNDQLIATRGQVGRSKIETNPAWGPQTVDFRTEKSELEIIIQASNYHYYKSGLIGNLLLGTPEQIRKDRESGIALEMLVFGMLLIIAVYHLILFVLRPSVRASLYFSLFCLIINLRLVVVGEAYLVNYFNLSYNIIYGMFFSYYLAVPILVLLIASLYPKEFSKKILIASQIVGLILLGVNDFFYSLELIDTGYYGQWGLVIFVILQSIILWRRFMRTVFAIENESQHLKEKNNRLRKLDKLKDEFVVNRTQNFKLSVKSIISAAKSIIHSSVSSLSASSRKDLAAIIRAGEGLDYILNDFIDYHNIKQERTEVKEEELRVNEIIEYVINFFQPFIDDKDIKFNNNIEINSYLIKGDKSRVVQVLYNILDDLSTTIEKGEISFSAQEVNNKIELRVKVSAGDILFRYQNSYFQLNHWEENSADDIDIKQNLTRRLIRLLGGQLDIKKIANKVLLVTIALPGTKQNEFPISKAVNDQSTDVVTEIEKNRVNLEDSEKSIVIIGNQATDFDFLKELVELESYSLEVLTDRKKANKRLNHNTALVILNLFTLNKSDLEFCQEIRKRFTVFELPILVMAARSKPENLIDGFELGINEFIRKPFVLSELKARIKTLITLKERVEESFKREQDFLRAQIKPHFLYNTLDTIAFLCDSNPAQASSLIMDLAQYLRYSFNFENLSQTVNINQELELLKFYVTIQQARFRDRIKVDYDFEENLNFAVPPLMIQTLVENAIEHGVLKQESGGTVKIKIKEKTDYFSIEVSDNGVGISESEITSLFRENNASPEGVGLQNINKRLKKLYNQELIITSSKGGGATVKFRIPKQ